ncbi:MAG: PAS domain S-box protein [Thermodesulfobacteriota bacterium]
MNPSLEKLKQRIQELEATLEEKNSLIAGCAERASVSARLTENQKEIQDILEQRVAERTTALALSNEQLRREIAERRAVEEALRESEEKYRLVINNANDAIFIAQNGYAQFPNPKAIQMIGYSREELARIPYLDLIHPDDRNLIQARKRIRRQGECVSSTYSLRVIHRSGEEVWVELNAAPITWEGKPATINFLRDITEQKQLEARLQQAQKMEAIGTLAGGIAHDFNNILYPIIAHTELLKLDLPAESGAQENLDKILSATQRAKELVQQILTFCRKTSSELKPMRLQPVLHETLKLLRASIPSTIAFELNMEEDCGAIWGDPLQIQRLFVNLCTNAFHAMEQKGGTLSVSLQRETVRDRRQSGPGAGEYLRLSVTDTGHGIPAVHLARIFDPYFTTKNPAKGTGLGLSVAHGIVKSHGGELVVKSQIERGTTFHAYFPIIHEAVEKEESHRPESIPTGCESILCVDDETEIVEVVGSVLESLGYRVTQMTSSAVALEHFKSRPADFDLVITDLTMPEMTGDLLARKILSIRGDIPIVLCTGYNRLGNMDCSDITGVHEHLIKPVSMADLARTVRRLLDAKKNDRRKCFRYRALPDTLAVSQGASGFQSRVIDIGRGGMAFEFAVGASDIRVEKSALLAICAQTVTSDPDPLELECRVVSLAPVPRETGKTADLLRCSVQFTDVSEESSRRIDELIERYIRNGPFRQAADDPIQTAV